MRSRAAVSVSLVVNRIPRYCRLNATLEQITYDAGRSALADQESLVAGIRGALLASHALVASFLGGTVLRDQELSFAAWVALRDTRAGLITTASCACTALWAGHGRSQFRHICVACGGRLCTPNAAGGQRNPGTPHDLVVGRLGHIGDMSNRCLARGPTGRLIFVTYSPTPLEKIKELPAWEIGIEQTRGAPRPWIFNAEAARRHRLEHPSYVRKLLARLGLLHKADQG